MLLGITTLLFVTTCLFGYAWYSADKEWTKAIKLNQDFIKLHRSLIQKLELEKDVSDRLRESLEKVTVQLAAEVKR